MWIPLHAPKNQLHLWAPQPPVANAALEELLKAWHKRTDTFHVVLIPRLMAPWWRQLFNKACDLTFFVSPSSSFWPSNMFEPLWIGIFSCSLTAGPGASRELHCWWNWEGLCRSCLRSVIWMQGIFCRNFLSSQDRWAPGRSAWHAECYMSCGQMPAFPMSTIKDKLGYVWHKEAKQQKD